MPTLILRTDHNITLNPLQIDQFCQLANLGKTKDVRVVQESIGYSEQPLVSYEQRIKSTTNAFSLLLDSLPKSKRKMINVEDFRQYAHHLGEELIQKLQKIDEDDLQSYQDLFQNHVRALVILLTRKTSSDPDNIAKNLARAEDYTVSAQKRPILATISQTSLFTDEKTGTPGYLIQLEKPITSLSNEIKQEFLNALSPDKTQHPAWFKALPVIEKNMIRTLLKDADKNNLDEKIFCLSSKLRSIPGLPNFSEHDTAILKGNGELTILPKRWRSSMISARDVIKKRQPIRDRMTQDNLKYLLETTIREKILRGELKGEGESIPVLLQTLITPIFFKEPDTSLYKDKERAIKAIQPFLETLRTEGIEIPNTEKKIKLDLTLIDTNHPLNPGRYLTPVIGRIKIGSIELYAGSKSARQGYQLIKLAKKSKQFSENDLLKQTTVQLKNLIDRSALLSYRTDNNRELFLSSYEQIITANLNGIAHGACVSGKDRKGLETIHTDAMQIYYEKYKKIPKYNDKREDRKYFVEIFTEIYVTRHQHVNAGQNAPGANGIKTPYLYLPKDIQENIQAWYDTNEDRAYSKDVLSDSNRLAGNNDLNKVYQKAELFSEADVQNEISHLLKFKRQIHAQGSDALIYNQLQLSTHHHATEMNLPDLENSLKSQIHPRVTPEITTKALPETQKQNLQLISQIKNIVENKYWDNKGKAGLITSVPKGIQTMRDFFKDYKEINLTNYQEVLEKINQTMLERLKETPQKRNVSTHSLYKTLLILTSELKRQTLINPLEKPKAQERLSQLSQKITFHHF